MTLSTNAVPDNHNDGLVTGDWRGNKSGHVYMVEGVSKDDAGNVTLTVHNPWGTNIAPKFGVDSPDPITTINLKQIIDSGHLDAIDIGTTAVTRQQEQTQQQNDPAKQPNAKDAPAPTETSLGCPYLDRLYANVNDPEGFGQALRDLGASPYGDAFRAEGRAMNLAIENQQLQQQLTQQQTQV